MVPNLYNISVVVVDYGGVMAHHYCEPYQTLLAEQLEVSLEESKKLISEKSSQGKLFRTGAITMNEFWQQVTTLSKTKNNVDFAYLQFLWAKTYILDNRVFELLQIVRNAAKKKLCLFTNTDEMRFAYIKNQYKLSQYFDFEVNSFQTKVLKPSVESFNQVISLCGQSDSPQNILFIDDRVQAVDQALICGVNGYIYTDYENLVEFFIKSNILTKDDFYKNV